MRLPLPLLSRAGVGLLSALLATPLLADALITLVTGGIPGRRQPAHR